MSLTKKNPTHCSKINIFGPRWLNIPLELPICNGTLSWNKTSTTNLHPTNATTLRIQGRPFLKSLILSSTPLSSTLKAIATSYSNCCGIWGNENFTSTTIKSHIAQFFCPMFLNSKNIYLFLLPEHCQNYNSFSSHVFTFLSSLPETITMKGQDLHNSQEPKNPSNHNQLPPIETQKNNKPTPNVVTHNLQDNTGTRM